MRQTFHAIRLPCQGSILDHFFQLPNAFLGDNTEMNGLVPHFVESFPQFYLSVEGIDRKRMGIICRKEAAHVQFVVW